MALHFYAPQSHKPKNWLYNTCLNKTFPSSRNASLIIQLPLFYPPLNSCFDGSNHRSLQGKSPSSVGFKSFIFFSFVCFLLHIAKNCAITSPLFLLKAFASYHLAPHMILHQIVQILSHNLKRWLPNGLKQQMILRQGATFFVSYQSQASQLAISFSCARCRVSKITLNNGLPHPIYKNAILKTIILLSHGDSFVLHFNAFFSTH